MPLDVRSKLEASTSVLLGNSKLNATRQTGPNSPGWARRVLANLEAHVANGVALTEESREALAAHQAAMQRLQVGDRVATDGNGNIVPAGILGRAIGVISRIGEDGQVEVTRLENTPIVPTTTEGSPRSPWYTGPTSASDLRRFVNEYMNEPPPPPNPNTPGGQARLNRQRAIAAAEAARRPSGVPVTTPPMSRTDEDRMREAQQQALLQLAAERRRQRMETVNSPPPPPPNPLQHAEAVVEGRPKRRVLRKKKNNE